jgi:hypothetical protein
MKPWWNNVRLVEIFLRKRFNPHPPLSASARAAVEQQQVAYDAIRWYGRRKLRRSLRKINHRLLHDDGNSKLAKEVKRIFEEEG